MAFPTREERAAKLALKANTSEEKVERVTKRIERVPVGSGNKLAFEGTDPDYAYRVVNDRPGRVAMFLKAGYEFCTEGETRKFDNGIAETGQIDSRKSLDLGGGDKGYLMRIRREFFDEDQAAKIEKVNQFERSMRNTPTKNNPYRGLTDE